MFTFKYDMGNDVINMIDCKRLAKESQEYDISTLVLQKRRKGGKRDRGGQSDCGFNSRRRF